MILSFSSRSFAPFAFSPIAFAIQELIEELEQGSQVYGSGRRAAQHQSQHRAVDADKPQREAEPTVEEVLAKWELHDLLKANQRANTERAQQAAPAPTVPVQAPQAAPAAEPATKVFEPDMPAAAAPRLEEQMRAQRTEEEAIALLLLLAEA